MRDQFRFRRVLTRWAGIDEAGRLTDKAEFEGPVRSDPPKYAWMLTDEERAAGLLRPIRFTYTHVICAGDTDIPVVEIAEAFARRPWEISAVNCIHCDAWCPAQEFTWKGSTERVGS